MILNLEMLFLLKISNQIHFKIIGPSKLKRIFKNKASDKATI